MTDPAPLDPAPDAARAAPTVAVVDGAALRVGTGGALAVGALAVGAFAIGALAIGGLAIGSLAVGRARFRRLHIDELTVDVLRLGRVEPRDRPS